MATVTVEELLAQHGEALRGFLAARCHDADVAADLLQEVAARLVAAAPRLDRDDNPRGYAFRAAANVWRDYVRRDIVRRRALERLQHEEPPAVRAADERVLQRDLRAAVGRAIAALPAAQRDVVRLRHT
jgi:RNA polymerase sigma factor (sigma-70 family)